METTIKTYGKRFFLKAIFWFQDKFTKTKETDLLEQLNMDYNWSLLIENVAE